MENNYSFEYGASKAAESSVIKNIFLWMAAGLALTGFVAHGLYTSGYIVQIIRSGMVLPLLIGEIALVFVITRNIMRFRASTGILLFLLYSALNGVTISSVFLQYTYATVSEAFFVTALLFGTMALYGMTTKKDLTKMGSYLTMGLIGVIIASLVNFFLQASFIYYIISIAGVIIFTGLTAYDVQKFTRLSQMIGRDDSETAMKVSIIGALNLYLDFINLFLFLLRFMGRRK